MPEPDTFDLDAAFRALEQDISAQSSAPGARAAVTRARRRRRTTIGAVAAGAVLVAGGVAFSQGMGGNDSAVPPISTSTEPAALDGSALSAATAGWTPAWSDPSKTAFAKILQPVNGECFFEPQGQGDPARVVLGNSHDDVAMADFRDAANDAAALRTDWDTLKSQMASCPQARSTGGFTSDAGQGLMFEIDPTDSESAPQYVWIVNTGQALAYLKIFDQTDPLPDANAAPVASALLSAAAYPGTYPTHDQSTGRNEPSSTLGEVWPATLEPAVAGWSSAWEPRIPRSAQTTKPAPDCTDELIGGPAGPAEDVNVGFNGHEWVQWYQNDSDATQALDRLRQDLELCATPYTFHTVTLDDGRPVLVGVGPQVFWATRVDTHVLILSLPTGDTPPPDDVSRAVGGVLEQILEKPATTTMAPGSTVPSWMQREIDVAPTFGP